MWGYRETGLILLSGAANVAVGGLSVELAMHDAIYIPRDSAVTVKTGTSVDIAEFSADVAGHYPVQIVRAAEMAKHPGL